MLQFSSLHDFFNMGGYATYVWSSYGVALLVVVGNLWQSWRSLKKTRQQLKRTMMK